MTDQEPYSPIPLQKRTIAPMTNRAHPYPQVSWSPNLHSLWWPELIQRVSSPLGSLPKDIARVLSAADLSPHAAHILSKTNKSNCKGTTQAVAHHGLAASSLQSVISLEPRILSAIQVLLTGNGTSFAYAL